jgi:arginyl-tRNA synthetase
MPIHSDDVTPNSPEPTLVSQVNRLLAAAFLACGLPTHAARAVGATRPELGDMQCNGAMPLAKTLRQNPGFDAVEVAGVGFINLRRTCTWATGACKWAC